MFRMNVRAATVAAAACAGALWCEPVDAQLVTPTSVTVLAGTEFFPSGGLIDNSGLNAIPTAANYLTVTHAAAGAGNAWVTDAPGGGAADYFALDPAIAPVPVMVFALDRQYELSGLVTWGYHFGAGNGNETKSFQLEFSTNGGGSFGAPINVTKPVASQANSSLQSFGGTYSANAVRVTFTDNFFEDWPGGDRVGLGEIKFLGEQRGFHLQIDRSTGRVVLNNDDPTAKAIAGIDITSAVGGLNPAGWTSIAGNYDANNGGSVDPTNTWTVVASTSGNLAEVSLGTANLTPGRTVDLGTAWQQSPFEDVAIKVLLGDGSVSTLPVFFTGNGGESFATGDLNFDGAIDAADWPIYRAGYRADLSSLSLAAAYAQGDLNGDGANNVTDFTLFKNAFDATNGVGAFQAMLASAVPEPTTWLLCGVAGALAATRRRRVAGLAACWALALTACWSLPGAEVQAAVPELVAHWALDSNANDAAGGFNGTPTAVTFGQPGANANTGTAASFDGATSTITVPYASALNPASYTVTLWANASSTTGYQSAITSRDDVNLGQSTHGYILYNDPNGVWDYWTGDGDPGWATLAGPTVNVGAWNHFALTFDAVTGTKSLFVDGVRVATTTAQGYSPNGTVETESLHIGSGQDDGANFFFAGLIDDVAVFQGVLTSQEIAAVGSQGVAAFTPIRLALQVNTDNGAVSIRNASGAAVELDQYEVFSPSGALIPAQWSSIQDSPAAGFPGGTGSGNGWEELGVANDQFLAEGYLQGASTLANGGALLLGNPFDGSAQDLQFSYRLPSGDVVAGVVEYVSGGIPGDFNGDSRVDGRDLLAWQRGFGAAFDGGDLADWADNFGSGAAAAASGAIPEPATLALLAGVAAMGLCRRNKAMARNLVCMAALCAAIQPGSAEAAVTLERNYLFGEGQGENGAAGATVGSNNSLAPGATLDDEGPSGAFLDLFQASGPVYANVATLGRPGAAAGALGIRFDGVDDRLQGTALNIPEEMAEGIPGYPFNYTGILHRGLQFWAYPEAAGINRGVQQGLVMDTIASGGPVITADGKWGQVNSQHSDGLDGIAPVPATVDVVPNAWAHVMHHVYPATGPGAPAIVPQTGAGRNATSVVYVNGVAVSANNDTIDFGLATAQSRVGVLSVGAEEIGGDGITPAFGNYFQGVMDELQMYVYGDNTASGGQNYGSFDLFADNAWIAGQIASSVPGGTLTDGDVDRDGDVDNGDVDAFIAGWKKEKRLTGAHNVMTVGDWETWSWGDMNHDGVVDLFDWHLLRTNHPQGAALDLGALLAGAAVPEASTAALACLALVGQLRRRRTA